MAEFGNLEMMDETAAIACSSEPSVLGSARMPVVLGFGNVLLRDDGAGVQLTEILRVALGTAAGIFVDGGTMSFSLLPYLEETDALLVIDAADLRGAPGTLAMFEGEEMDRFLRISRRRSVHEIGLIDLLDMARLRGCLPSRRALLCVQPDRIDWGEELSPSVSEVLPHAAQQAAELLTRWTLS